MIRLSGNKKHILIGVIVALLWLGFGVKSQLMVRSGISDRLGPTYFPTLMAVIGFALSLLVIWKAAYGKKPADRQDEAADERRPNYRRSLAMLCVPFAWPLVVPYVGFIIATPLLLAAELLLLGIRSPLKLGIVSCAMTAVVWVVFAYLFGVEFPGPNWGG